ncbi:nickel import ATP-binding protein NikE [Candidatus Arsenophonus nilaparvatae]|uniref:nickel import ATP-binding protein NikE n=1 Tax=Candidatus Arsenophonus nilaparvatae TaxID=1247023 RepID=UPI00050978CA|nr:nickel import ATP-binding protein NikE [Candidatus Arsenophonus nilaparvatae]
MTLLDIDRVTFGYPDLPLLLNQITLTLKAGETVALLGRSGCGKSTLARLLVGLISPSCGEIRWCGTSLTKLKGKAISQFRKDVQIVFQDPITAVNPRKTIDEIIREPIRHLLSLTKKEQHARITKMLNAVELDSFLLNQRPPQLSGGQLQRVCLARAMVVEPKLLILDEAVSNLDLILQAEIIQLLKNLQQQFHTACLFITHDLRLVERLCQQIMIMENGQIVETSLVKSPLFLHSKTGQALQNTVLPAFPVRNDNCSAELFF